MKRYYMSERLPDAHFNTGKWRIDVETMLEQKGYKKISLRIPPARWKRLFLYLAAARAAMLLPGDGLVFFHFPLRSRAFRFMLSMLRLRRIKTIALIHDIEGLRDRSALLLQAELALLKRFDGVLAQNETMRRWLQQHGILAEIITLAFHDSPTPGPPLYRASEKQPELCFAGNLEKAPFLNHLGELQGLRVHIYGNAAQLCLSANACDHGLIDPAELPETMKGSFGLVWDGPAIDTCSGGYGEYLRYNTPYKMTAYALAGLPMLVWKESAMADWVSEQNIGRSVSSLQEIEALINAMTAEEYDAMKKNLLPVQEKIRGGWFFFTALQKLEKIVVR